MMQRNNGVLGAPHPACASCKHQRKKCDENCILAPFFPAERNREFQAVHKVFGVSNIQKIIKSRDEKDRKVAAESLVWEAYCWQKDPDVGPYGEYRKICDEYRKICDELKLYQSGQCQQQPMSGMQVLGQDGLVYKSPPSFQVGWNGNNGISNKGSFGNEVNSNNGLNYNHNNMVNPSSYCYALKRDGDDLFNVPLQQNSMNGFSSQYYLEGQFSPINGKTMDNKTMDNAMWESGS